MTRRRRWRNRLLAGGLLAVGGWLGTSYLVVAQLTSRARTPFAEPPPALAWGTIEPLRLTTTDGLELGAWFVPGRPDRPAVLLVHGNGGCRSGCLGPAELAASTGCPVLLVTVRAHGDSDGEVNDIGWSARQDVAAGVAWLREKLPGRPVVVWGQSLGSAAAVFAAPDLPAEVGGYILECPYADLRTAVWNRLRSRLPLVPSLVAYAGMRLVTPVALPDADRISPLDAAARVPPAARVLVLAGGADKSATVAEAEAITERLGGRAECVVFEAGGHLSLEAADPVAYRAAVVRLIDRCVRVSSPTR